MPTSTYQQIIARKTLMNALDLYCAVHEFQEPCEEIVEGIDGYYPSDDDYYDEEPGVIFDPTQPLYQDGKIVNLQNSFYELIKLLCQLHTSRRILLIEPVFEVFDAEHKRFGKQMFYMKKRSGLKKKK